MNTECTRIADEMRSTLEGNAWYGDSVKRILQGITAEQATKHPVPSAHSIWELVLHVTVWAQAAANAIKGTPIPKYPWPPAEDFPPVRETSDAAWQSALSGLFATYAELTKLIEGCQDNRLAETVPGRSYNFYHLLHGMAQHAVYHAGQIALLKKNLNT